jgi:hypothetical protein
MSGKILKARSPYRQGPGALRVRPANRTPLSDTEMTERRHLPRPDPVIDAYLKHVDRTLIRENLKLTPEQRLRKLMALQRFAEELKRAGRRAARG